MEKNNIWLSGIMGLVTGDALGNPVQFSDREVIRSRKIGPVTGMESGGVYHTPAGTWTDDSSMTLATLDSIREIGSVVPSDIMLCFVSWLKNGAYTPFGRAFDEGNTCSGAINAFDRTKDWKTCGRTGEMANGNGALMRILPVCLHFVEQWQNGRKHHIDKVIKAVHQVTALTHNHLRAKIGSGIYYFLVREVILGKGSLTKRLQKGMNKANDYYAEDDLYLQEFSYYGRMRDLKEFSAIPEDQIKTKGYVVFTLEAALWCLINTSSYQECMLKAVNLGDDADTVAAVAGGLAGLYYGYDKIPEEWLSTLQKREWVEGFCLWDYRSLIPFTDIHCHFIPSVDDGSRDMEMSLEMIRSEYRQGVRGLILTPHTSGVVEKERYEKNRDRVMNWCKKEFPDLTVGNGCEVLLTGSNTKRIANALGLKMVPLLNGTNYVLVEFLPYDITLKKIRDCLLQIKDAGYIPVIANAERYGDICRSFEDIRWFKENGCKIQINIYSLYGESNEKIKNYALKMVEEKLVDFLGTDSHRMDYRPPRIANGMKALLQMTDRDYAEKIAYRNAEELLGIKLS